MPQELGPTEGERWQSEGLRVPGASPDTCTLPGGADDTAAGKPQIPVPFQEEVHHPPRQEEGGPGYPPAKPLSDPHERQRPLYPVPGRKEHGGWWGLGAGPDFLLIPHCFPGASRSTLTAAFSTPSSASSSRFGTCEPGHQVRVAGVGLELTCSPHIFHRSLSRVRTTRALCMPGWAGHQIQMKPSWQKISSTPCLMFPTANR